MRSRSQARQTRIEEIALQIAELSNELQELLVEDNTSPTTARTNPSTTTVSGQLDQFQDSDSRRDPRSYFSVGDRIVITNNYRGYRGRTGTVTEIGQGRDEYIHFRQGSPSIITKRKPHSIRKL